MVAPVKAWPICLQLCHLHLHLFSLVPSAVIQLGQAEVFTGQFSEVCTSVLGSGSGYRAIACADTVSTLISVDP